MTAARLDTGRGGSEEALSSAGREARVIPIPLAKPHALALARRERRWGVVLAGGDGVRLKPLTEFVCGDDRPKQFCPLFESKTLLGQTLERARLSVPAEQTLVSLAGEHFKFYSQEAALSPSQRVVQPMNKGTAPPIVHGLLSIAQMDEQALVAILPSDHYFSDEGAFAAVLESAFKVAAGQPDSVVLLGARPRHPEVEYGWIELGAPLGPEGSELFRVNGFQEKPKLRVARTLFAQGAVWNTFVMVGHVQAFLEMIQARVPDLLEEMGRARLWGGEETHIEYSLYLHISTSSFSSDVLPAESERLRVLRLNNTGWSDLGDPARVASLIHRNASKPGWFERWRDLKGVAAGTTEAKSAIA